MNKILIAQLVQCFKYKAWYHKIYEDSDIYLFDIPSVDLMIWSFFDKNIFLTSQKELCYHISFPEYRDSLLVHYKIVLHWYCWVPQIYFQQNHLVLYCCFSFDYMRSMSLVRLPVQIKVIFSLNGGNVQIINNSWVIYQIINISYLNNENYILSVDQFKTKIIYFN